MIAQIINWNGIFWDEPRSVVQFQTLAAFIIAQVAIQWLPWYRVRGLVVGVTVVVILTVIRLAPLVLHPENPIGTSNSSGIQFTFLILFVLSTLGAGGWCGRRDLAQVMCNKKSPHVAAIFLCLLSSSRKVVNVIV